jgi:hypothetical protein
MKVEPSLDPGDYSYDLLSRSKQSRSEKKVRKAISKLGWSVFHLLVEM